MAQIILRGLRKAYGASTAGYAVDGIDLTVQDGEVMALVGPSGCGKTTTLQLIAGFLQPDAGEISIGERLVSSASFVVPPERRSLSLIFQSYAVWPHKTVHENVAYGLHVRKIPRAELARRVKAMLSTVRLNELAGRYPAELSGGQQQRVALARALVVEPEILLLDEPLSNLDANLREEMRFEIRRLHDETGITMVYVTHDQAEAMVTADRIALMNRGKIEQIGTAREIYEQPRSTFAATFIGRTNILQGTLLERGIVECNGTTVTAIDVSGAQRGSRVAVCIRPHLMTLVDAASKSGSLAADGDGAAVNQLAGRVIRRTYLGETHDYLVQVCGGTQVRVTAEPSAQFAVGDAVRLQFAADVGRILRAAPEEPASG